MSGFRALTDLMASRPSVTSPQPQIQCVPSRRFDSPQSLLCDHPPEECGVRNLCSMVSPFIIYTVLITLSPGLNRDFHQEMRSLPISDSMLNSPMKLNALSRIIRRPKALSHPRSSFVFLRSKPTPLSSTLSEILSSFPTRLIKTVLAWAYLTMLLSASCVILYMASSFPFQTSPVPLMKKT